MKSVSLRMLCVCLVYTAVCNIGLAQSVALNLSSGSGVLGSTVTLNLSLASSGVQPADFQWMLNYSTSDFTAATVVAGSAATAAGKSISCNSTAGGPTCVLWGLNSSTIGNGVIATVTLTISGATHNASSLVQVMNAGSASEPGLNVSTSGVGGTVTIIQPTTYTISGTITPATGGGGTAPTMTLTNASGATVATTTASAGAYSFTGLANGTYTVTPSLSGFTYTPVSRTVTISSANQTANFTAVAGTYTISGTITPATGGGGTAPTMTLTNASGATVATTTASAGAYSFTGLANGTYKVTPSLSGFAYTPTSTTVTISGANQTANFTAIAGTYTISGTITPATGGGGAAPTMTLTNSSGATVTTTNASAGAYSFTGLANGTYTVTPRLSGFSYTPASTTVTISGTNQAANFTATLVTSLTVTGIICNPDAVIPPAASTCQVTISSPAPAGGIVVSLSDNSSNVIEPPSLTISAGAATSSFTATTTSVSTPTTVLMTASLGASSASYPLSLLPPAPAIGLGVDVTVSEDFSPSKGFTSPTFSTGFADELLLAFISAGRGASSTTVTNVTGAGLTWVLVVRENVQDGTAEIWRAFAPAKLTNVSVTATLSGNFYASVTVMSFTGVDPSGANGSGAIGVTAVANSASGTPSVGLVTTRDGSWVVAVGNDTRSNVSRVPGTGQNVVHQDLLSNNSAYWVQEEINPTPVSGTTVTINDTAPSTTYNLSAVEILPPAACVVSPVPASRMFGIAGGSTNVIVADGPGCNWTVSTNSPAWITIGGGTGTGNGSFTSTISPSSGPTRMGSITVGGQSFKVLEQGTTSVFADVVSTTPNFDYINLMYSLGISPGCSTSPFDYCPSVAMTRGQMATYVVSALDGINYVHGGVPSSYTLTPYFADVPATSPLFPFVQRLADLHLALACTDGTPPSFCPSSTELQQQMAKILILGWMHANNLSSFTYSLYPYFTDVPPSSPFFPYIQKMRDMGFWMGCTSTAYCPSNAVLKSDVAAQVMRSLLGAP